jgi:hypothetical protein
MTSVELAVARAFRSRSRWSSYIFKVQNTGDSSLTERFKLHELQVGKGGLPPLKFHYHSSLRQLHLKRRVNRPSQPAINFSLNCSGEARTLLSITSQIASHPAATVRCTDCDPLLLVLQQALQLVGPATEHSSYQKPLNGMSDTFRASCKKPEDHLFIQVVLLISAYPQRS